MRSNKKNDTTLNKAKFWYFNQLLIQNLIQKGIFNIITDAYKMKQHDQAVEKF